MTTSVRSAHTTVATERVAPHSGLRRLQIAMLLTAGIMVFETFGGLASHSLALLSDAGHILTDVIVMGISWFALRQETRPPDSARTFGYHRVGILTALFNALLLVAISIAIGFAAYQRLLHPQTVQPGLMLLVAAAGLVANGAIVWLLSPHQGNLPLRSTLLHVLGDLGAAGGVVVGGGVIYVTRDYWVDTVISLVIVILIVANAIRLVISAVDVLLEAAPRGISLPQVVEDMHGVSGVRSVHDLHVWYICTDVYALSCHVMLDETSLSASSTVLQQLQTLLSQRFGIGHVTIQAESVECETPDQLYCQIVPRGHAGG